MRYLAPVRCEKPLPSELFGFSEVDRSQERPTVWAGLAGQMAGLPVRFRLEHEPAVDAAMESHDSGSPLAGYLAARMFFTAGSPCTESLPGVANGRGFG